MCRHGLRAKMTAKPFSFRSFRNLKSSLTGALLRYSPQLVLTKRKIRTQSLPFAFRVRRFITATGCRATLSPRGSIPRVRRRGNQSGKKLNITPEKSESASMREARVFAASIAKFWSFWPNNPRFNRRLFPLKFLLGRKRLQSHKIDLN